MIGVELVKDKKTKEPASRGGRQDHDLTKDAGVLIGKGGAAGNVLRIKPPLCFTKGDADAVVSALQEALTRSDGRELSGSEPSSLSSEVLRLRRGVGTLFVWAAALYLLAMSVVSLYVSGDLPGVGSRPHAGPGFFGHFLSWSSHPWATWPGTSAHRPVPSPVPGRFPDRAARVI